MENEERSIRYKISQKYREENFSLKMKRRMKLSRLGEADNKGGNSPACYCIILPTIDVCQNKILPLPPGE